MAICVCGVNWPENLTKTPAQRKVKKGPRGPRGGVSPLFDFDQN